MQILAIIEREITRGTGRGSRRRGRTGVRARVVTDDDGESFYVIVSATAAGQITDAPESVSTSFADAGDAERWAREALAARVAP